MLIIKSWNNMILHQSKHLLTISVVIYYPHDANGHHYYDITNNFCGPCCRDNPTTYNLYMHSRFFAIVKWSHIPYLTILIVVSWFSAEIVRWSEPVLIVGFDSIPEPKWNNLRMKYSAEPHADMSLNMFGWQNHCLRSYVLQSHVRYTLFGIVHIPLNPMLTCPWTFWLTKSVFEKLCLAIRCMIHTFWHRVNVVSLYYHKNPSKEVHPLCSALSPCSCSPQSPPFSETSPLLSVKPLSYPFSFTASFSSFTFLYLILSI